MNFCHAGAPPRYRTSLGPVSMYGGLGGARIETWQPWVRGGTPLGGTHTSINLEKQRYRGTRPGWDVSVTKRSFAVSREFGSTFSPRSRAASTRDKRRRHCRHPTECRRQGAATLQLHLDTVQVLPSRLRTVASGGVHHIHVPPAAGQRCGDASAAWLVEPSSWACSAGARSSPHRNHHHAARLSTPVSSVQCTCER